MRYLVGPGRHNEHTSPHLVGGSSGVMAWWDDAVLSAADAKQIADLLDTPRVKRGVAVPHTEKVKDPETGEEFRVTREANVWHCSLSLNTSEGELGDEKWAAIANRFVELMGINDGVRSEARWAAVHHGQSTAGNDHVHIAVALVRDDGTKVSTHFDRPRSQKVCAALERDFGLEVLESRENGRSQQGLSRGEVRRAREGGEPDRRYLERVVSGAATAARSEDEFVRRVRAAGVLIRPRFASGGQKEVEGYSVARRTVAGEERVWFGGRRLSHDLSLPRLRAGFESAEDGAALAEWRAAWRGVKPVGRGPEVETPSPETWQRGLDEMQAIARKLSAVPLDDHATWTSVARQVGGVLSAWSHRLEPEPGPLAAAAKNVR
ncbi:MAG: relaxase/mobilization nuclease domain-containing protein, partial [Brachybacterium sp.]